MSLHYAGPFLGGESYRLIDKHDRDFIADGIFEPAAGIDADKRIAFVDKLRPRSRTDENVLELSEVERHDLQSDLRLSTAGFVLSTLDFGPWTLDHFRTLGRGECHQNCAASNRCRRNRARCTGRGRRPPFRQDR